MTGLRWNPATYAAWREREAKRSGDLGMAEALHVELVQPAASARIVLPWPPSGNHGTRHAGGAHYLTREHIDYRAKVLELVTGMRQRPPLGRLRVTAHFAVPDKRRRDLDNVWKVASDALQHAGLIWDDSAIDELHLYRTPVVKGGAVNVLIESLA